MLNDLMFRGREWVSIQPCERLSEQPWGPWSRSWVPVALASFWVVNLVSLVLPGTVEQRTVEQRTVEQTQRSSLSLSV
jgi:hypothetical protein